jgi:hypothetical protein
MNNYSFSVNYYTNTDWCKRGAIAWMILGNEKFIYRDFTNYRHFYLVRVQIHIPVPNLERKQTERLSNNFRKQKMAVIRQYCLCGRESVYS